MKAITPHYNGKYGYYLPLPHNEIKLFTETTLADYLISKKINRAAIIDDATGKEKIWE